MRKLFKSLYRLGLLKSYDKVDGIRYLRRLEKGKHPQDQGYFSERDAMQYRGGPCVVHRRFRGGSVFLHCDRTIPVEWKLLQSGWFDRDVLELVADLARPGTAIVDVGGNVGGLAIPWAKAMPEVKVLSFEPNPAALARFRQNLALNPLPNLSVIEKALGAEAGRLELHAYDGRYLGDSSFVRPGRIEDPGRLIEVEVVALDDYFGRLNLRPSVLKLDVQGYEDQVLAGAEHVLAAMRPAVVFEHEDHNFTQPEMAWQAKDNLRAVFERHDYRVFYLTRYNRDLMFPVDWQRPLSGNLLALPR